MPSRGRGNHRAVRYKATENRPSQQAETETSFQIGLGKKEE
jgi:hypothetical protein